MKVAILVLNYNGKALLSTYLGSVVRHKEEAEVWVVDNGSTDDSLDLVKKNFPEVKVLVLDNNFGYTKDESEAGYKNFCVIRCKIKSIEWLYLAAKGHRRALIDLSESKKFTWLVP